MKLKTLKKIARGMAGIINQRSYAKVRSVFIGCSLLCGYAISASHAAIQQQYLSNVIGQTHEYSFDGNLSNSLFQGESFSDLEEVVTEIERLLAELNFSQAVEYSSSALNQYPENVFLLAFRSFAYSKMAKYLLAERDINLAKQIQPLNKDVNYLRIELLINMGNISSAIDKIKSIQKTYPKAFHNLLVQAYLQKADPQKALKSARFSLSQSPDDLLTIKLLYQACELTGEMKCLKEMEQLYLSTLAISTEETTSKQGTTDNEGDSSSADLTPIEYLESALVLTAENKFNAAIQTAGLLIQQYPNNIEGYLLKVNLLSHIKAYSDAHLVINEIEKIFPELPWVYSLKAKLFQLQGNYSYAKINYALQMKRTPEPVFSAEQYGEILIESGHYNEAVKYYLEALKKFPNDYLMCIRLAKAYRGLKQLKQAELHYKKAIQAYPKRSTAYRGLAVTKTIQSKFLEAEQLYQQSLTLNPDHYEGNSGMADVKNHQNKPIEAEPYARKAIKSAPENHVVYSSLARSLFLQNRKQQAKETCQLLENKIAQSNYQFLSVIYCYERIEDFSKALSLAKKIHLKMNTPDSAEYLAQAYKRDGKWQQAADLYQYILTINNNSITILNDYAWCLVELKQYKKALTVFDKAIILDQSSRTILNKGYAFNRMNDYKQASEMYQKSLKLNPEQPTLYFLIADALVKLEQNTKAIKWFKKAMIAEPTNENVYIGYTYNYYLLNDKVAFLAETESAMLLFPDSITLLRNARNAAETLNETNKTRQYLEKIISFKSVTAHEYDALATLYAQSGNMVEAGKLFYKAVKMEPNDAQLYSNLGYFYFMQRNFSKALETYRDALKIPGSESLGILHYNMALVFYATRNFQQAIDSVKHAKKVGYVGSEKFVNAIKQAMNR